MDHLHVPLQAGCDETLKRMNRKYNCEQYYEKLSKIRRLIPDIVLQQMSLLVFLEKAKKSLKNL